MSGSDNSPTGTKPAGTTKSKNDMTKPSPQAGNTSDPDMRANKKTQGKTQRSTDQTSDAKSPSGSADPSNSKSSVNMGDGGGKGSSGAGSTQ
jgi:hypothetical protein